MSTFFVLPPRPVLGEHFAGYLQTLFPGLDWSRTAWAALAEMLGAAVHEPDVYVIYRDDLPPEEDLDRGLIDGFGAEAGDQVVEVGPGTADGELTSRRWRLREAG